MTCTRVANIVSPGAEPNPDTVARVLVAVEAMAPMGASVTSAWAAPACVPECGDACAVIA